MIAIPFTVKTRIGFDDPAVFERFVPRIRDATDAVINITTGGGHGMTLDERIAAAVATAPEMASLNMGSINFGLYHLLDKYKDFKFDWEKSHLAALDDPKLKKGLKMVWFSTGSEDNLITVSKASVEMLNKHGFAATFQESTGAHEGVSFPRFPGHPARRVSSGGSHGNEDQAEAEEARGELQA